MHWIDWLIVVVPLIIVLIIGLRAQRYVRDVSDFLAEGMVGTLVLYPQCGYCRHYRNGRKSGASSHHR